MKTSIIIRHDPTNTKMPMVASQNFLNLCINNDKNIYSYESIIFVFCGIKEGLVSHRCPGPLKPKIRHALNAYSILLSKLYIQLTNFSVLAIKW